MRTPFFFLLGLLFLGSCASDSTTDQTAAEEASAAQQVALDSTKRADLAKVRGFNYLTDCDEPLIATLALRDPEVPSQEFSYVMGTCTSNKSYDYVLVPKAGHTPSQTFGEVQTVLAEAKASKFEDYIPYAFIIPRSVQVDKETDVTSVEALYPANVTVYRFDQTTWNRLGADRVEDEAAYDRLRWDVLHDQPLKYQ